MLTLNTCYTYFRIVGDFDPDEITKRLNITPFESWKKGDLRNDGSKQTFSAWHYGKCEQFDLEVCNQMSRTIEKLKDKTEELNRIRNEYDLSFYLEVVPELYAGETCPALAPSLEVIDFCHATRTEIDIDLYLYEEK